MSRLTIVNLLDDFALGGVTKGLNIFDTPELRRIGKFRTQAIDPTQILAPKIDAEVIITHFPPNWRRLAFFASLRLRNPNAKLIHVEHSYSREWARLQVPHPGRFKLMLNWSFRFFDDVVVVSKAQKAWMLDEKIAAGDKIRVIHPYSCVPGLADVPDLKPVSQAPLVIGAYGRFCDAKGFDLLIDAVKRTDAKDNLELVLGGFGHDEAALRLRADGCSRIRLVGKVTNVADFLAMCDVIVVPSRYEAYGQVANEARAAGRPILVSTAGGLPEQVGDAGLIVDCQDPDALLGALQALRALPLPAMGHAGRQSVGSDRSDRLGEWLSLLNRSAVNAPKRQRTRRVSRANLAA
jgi:glycosyltransferase involved in cell wall biosynthesis